MGRERLARFLTACTECGGQVVAFAQDLPEPARCDACRAAGPPKRRMVTCSREGCDQQTMITGSQRRRWELGRPVFCSKGCRYLATHPVAHCAGCGVAMKRRGAARNRHRPTCSPACQGLLQRTTPDRTCPECGTVFRSRARVQTCSMACGIRHRDRKLRGRVATAFQWLCPVCDELTESMDVRRLGRPCSRRCANTWRTRPDHRPVVR